MATHENDLPRTHFGSTARPIKEDTVVLERDIPEQGLCRGDLGAVVMAYEPDGLDVEFMFANGETHVLIELKVTDLRHPDQNDMMCVRTVST